MDLSGDAVYYWFKYRQNLIKSKDLWLFFDGPSGDIV